MLDRILKKRYLRHFYKCFEEFLEVLSGKTSLKLYLAYNYPIFYRPGFREGEKLKRNGFSISYPKTSINEPLPDLVHLTQVILGQYSIPECDVKKNDIVFDVGAHIGFFSYFALNKGAKIIYAFEPNPYVFEILKKHAKLWSDKIKPFEIAIYSSDGFHDLSIPHPLAGGSTLRDIDCSQKVRVKTTTLDNFVKKHKIERVDFIKIDAEGAEREIIKGAKKTIKKFKPRMAIAAYHLSDDKRVIPELVLSIRNDYRFKLVNKGDEDLFFF